MKKAKETLYIYCKLDGIFIGIFFYQKFYKVLLCLLHTQTLYRVFKVSYSFQCSLEAFDSISKT